jgi:hypothetical protein
MATRNIRYKNIDTIIVLNRITSLIKKGFDMNKYLKLHIKEASSTGYKSKYYINKLVELVASCTLFAIFTYAMYVALHIL